MKRASEILLLIGGIVPIVTAFTFLILGIVFGVLSGSADFIREGLEEGSIHTTLPGTIDQQVAAIQIVFLTFAIVFFVLAVFGVICAIISFAAKKKQTTGLLVAAIVFGIISGSEVSAVGGIFGFIARAQQQ